MSHTRTRRTNNIQLSRDVRFEQKRSFSTIVKSCVIVFTCTFLCYANTLESQFVYDDNRCILRNQDLLPSTPWTNILYNDFWGTPLSHSGSHKSYRPLCILSFRVNYMFGELNPYGYHLVNVILHSIVSCLVLYLCRMFFEDESVALIGGLMFGLHPIHTEAVAGVVGRADVGAAMFFLISLILYCNSTKHVEDVSYTRIIFSWIACLCSMYTKEQGFTVIGVAIAYEVLFVSQCNLAYPYNALNRLSSTNGRNRILATTLFGIVALYSRFLIMGNSLPDFSPADNPAANESNQLTRLLTFSYLPLCNFWLFLFPSNLSYDYSITNVPLVENVFSVEVLLSLVFYSVLTVYGILYLYYFRQIFSATTNRTNKPEMNRRMNDALNSLDENTVEMKDALNVTIFGLALIILPFLPATNLFFYVGFIIAERILYIPSIGFCLLVTNGINLLIKKHAGKRRKILTGVSAVLIIFALKTFNRNFVWKDEETLYRSGLSTSPAKSFGNLANIYLNQSKLSEAEHAYRTALKYRFNMADTHYNLGILLQNQNRLEEAEKCYRDAIVYRPRLAAAHLNLGVTLMSMKRLEDALDVLQNASEISDHGLKDPILHAVSLTSIRYNKGRVLFDMKRYEEAIDVFLDAIQRMPDHYEAHSLYNMLGQCYTALENYEYAGPWYIRALDEKPDHVPALLACARHFHTTGKEGHWNLAKHHLNNALTIEPNKIETYLMYGGFFEERKDFESAISILNNAMKIEKHNVQLLTLLGSVYRGMENYQEAIKYQLLARDVNPQDTSILMNLGALYHLSGKLHEANTIYQKALKLDPTSEILLENIKKLERALKV